MDPGNRSSVGRDCHPMGDSHPWYRQGPISHTYTVCDMCPWHCGIIVETVNGVVHKIDGNPNDPKSRGRLCAKGQGGVSFLYDPDRLKTPLIRTGERGAGDFREPRGQRPSMIAQKMGAIRTEHGPESIAFLGHTGGDSWFVDHLAQAWGSPNAGRPSTSLCTGPRDEAALLTTGLPIGGHEPVDWDQIEALHSSARISARRTRNTVMQDFSKARARGAKVVVVDILVSPPPLPKLTCGCPSSREQTRRCCWHGFMSSLKKSATRQSTWIRGPWDSNNCATT